MSTEREVVTASGATRQVTDAERDAAAKEVARAGKKARIARVLERGYLVDRMTIDLPSDKHGEWVPVDQVDRWASLGFENGVEFAKSRGLHGGTDGYAHIGDVVFMVCPKEDKEIMEEVRMEQYVAMHGSPQQKKEVRQREEKDFESRLQTEARELPVVEEGSARAAHREEIREAITAKATNDIPSLTSTPKK